MAAGPSGVDFRTDAQESLVWPLTVRYGTTAREKSLERFSTIRPVDSRSVSATPTHDPTFPSVAHDCFQNSRSEEIP